MFSIKSCFNTLIAFFMLLSTQVIAAKTSTVSQAQLMSLLAAPSTPAFMVLDVRSKEEFAQGHIAGAINISHDTLNEKISNINQYKRDKVIVYCRSGRRAAMAETILTAQGFSQVRHLSGDINGWTKANLPLVTSSQ